MQAPYWSDGLRAVFILGDDATGLNDINVLDWEQRGKAQRPAVRLGAP
jgi:hypothetical protein